MLEINNLSVSLIKDDRPLFTNLSLTINKGEKVALISEEGNGKSTLLKLINGETMEHLLVKGQIKTHQQLLGYLPQTLKRQERSVMEYFSESLPDLYQDYGSFLARLQHFGLPEDLLNRSAMSTLSGGERIKCQLIVLELLKPDIYLLDEPSNDIDLKTIYWLEEFILKLEQPLLFVSHDELLIHKCATRILHLENTHRKTRARHTLSSLSYFDYIEDRVHRLNKDSQVALDQRRMAKERDQKLQRQFEKVQHDLRSISRQDPSGGRLLKKKMKSIKSKEKRYEKEETRQVVKPDFEEAINLQFNVKPLPASKVIVSMEKERLRVGNRILIPSYDLHISAQEHVGIIGDNGSGKTTLLKVIEERLQAKTELKVGVMPQDYESRFDIEKTPLSFLSSTHEKSEQDLIHNYLGALKFTYTEMTQSISNLSGGQKAKLYLAKFILGDCNVLLLDEPTRNLSPLSNPELRRMLKDYQGCLISISHDRLFLRETCHTVYELSQSGLSVVDIVQLNVDSLNRNVQFEN